MLVECVPNFSEGRKIETIDSIARAIESEPGVIVLNRHIDVDHNRSVITFVGAPQSIANAALKAVATAKELIDLRAHAGVHPRIGATDVLPFVPVSGVTMDECMALAHTAGQRIWNELSIPVYFYERAALVPERKRLEHVRNHIDPVLGGDAGGEIAGQFFFLPALLGGNLVILRTGANQRRARQPGVAHRSSRWRPHEY